MTWVSTIENEMRRTCDELHVDYVDTWIHRGANSTFPAHKDARARTWHTLREMGYPLEWIAAGTGGWDVDYVTARIRELSEWMEYADER